jgi:hypothetical protein
MDMGYGGKGQYGLRVVNPCHETVHEYVHGNAKGYSQQRHEGLFYFGGQVDVCNFIIGA